MREQHVPHSRKRLGWSTVVVVVVAQVAPCNVQYPPDNTELFWGVAIAMGDEGASSYTGLETAAAEASVTPDRLVEGTEDGIASQNEAALSSPAGASESFVLSRPSGF